MATFNVDSLDFVDDEEARFGADSDFATRFSSANTRLELEDITNATVGYVPQNVGTDLVGGKFAETVSEGKALADDGDVYDSIQNAVDAASSWVKVGPGTFNESITISTAGLTLTGSGDRTIITGGGDAISVQQPDATVSELRSECSGTAVIVDADSVDVLSISGQSNGTGQGVDISDTRLNCRVIDCEFDNYSNGINPRQVCESLILAHNTITNSVDGGINSGADDAIIVGNVIRDVGGDGINVGNNDSLAGYNIVYNIGSDAIKVAGTDCIVFNNRLFNYSGSAVLDNGTNTQLDANLTT